MKTRILAAAMSLLLLVGLLPTAVAESAQGGNKTTPTLSVTANKTTAEPGDEIEFTIKLSPVENLMSLFAKVVIPKGLTVESGSMNQELKASGDWIASDFDTPTENNNNCSLFLAVGDKNYTLTSETEIATFTCLVDTEFTGTANVSIDNKTLELYCGKTVDDPDGEDVTNTLQLQNAKIDVIIPATEVSLNKNELVLGEGASETLEATVIPGSSTDKVTFTSSDPTIATVDKNTGKITAKSADPNSENAATVTITAQAGDKSASCTVKVIHVFTDAKAVAGTNSHERHCVNHPNVTIGPEEHYGGTATCTELAVCTVCGEPYGELAAHELETVGYKAATCGTAGYTGDKVCKNCEQVIEKGTTIPATGEHTWEATEGKEPTCTEDGYTAGQVCKTCSAVKDGDVIPATGHHYETVAGTEKSATCTKDGKEADQKCKYCDDVKTGAVIPATGHNYEEVAGTAKAATCTEVGKEADQKCKYCDDVKTGAVIPATGHNYEEVAGTAKAATCTEAGKEADQKCKDCDDVKTGAAIPATGHTSVADASVNKAATCTEKGWEGATVCETCGEKLEAGHETNALGHELKKVEAKDATCTENGNTEYWACVHDGCTALFLDEEQTQPTDLETVTLSKLGHKMIHHAYVAATATADGNEAYDECETCHGLFTAAGTKLDAVPVIKYEEKKDDDKKPTQTTDKNNGGQTTGTASATSTSKDNKDTKSNQTSQSKADATKTGVKTGDQSLLEISLIVMGVAAVTLIAVVVIGKKRENRS